MQHRASPPPWTSEATKHTTPNTNDPELTKYKYLRYSRTTPERKTHTNDGPEGDLRCNKKEVDHISNKEEIELRRSEGRGDPNIR
jgi:hypothetical protein